MRKTPLDSGCSIFSFSAAKCPAFLVKREAAGDVDGFSVED